MLGPDELIHAAAACRASCIKELGPQATTQTLSCWPTPCVASLTMPAMFGRPNWMSSGRAEGTTVVGYSFPSAASWVVGESKVSGMLLEPKRTGRGYFGSPMDRVV